MYKGIVRDYVRLRRRLYLGEYGNESLTFRGTWKVQIHRLSLLARSANTLEKIL